MASSSDSNSWRESAQCRNENWNLFFEGYENGNPSDLAYVDELCLQCPVQHECLLMGVLTSGTGVHGGAYLSLGQLAKAKNAHKTAERIQELHNQIAEIKRKLAEDSE